MAGVTVDVVETRPTGRTPNEIVEVGQPTHCAGCGQPFDVPRFTTSWRQCSCGADEHGHRVWICLRGECRAATDVPPCLGNAELPNPLAGHARYGQRGPVADFGDG